MVQHAKKRKFYHRPADSKIVKWIIIFFLLFVGLVFVKKLLKYQDKKWDRVMYLAPSPVVDQNIFVFTPAPNDTIKLPYTVTGKARTFESSVQMRIEDTDGNSLYRTYVMADAPEMGEYGPYSMRLSGIEPGLQELYSGQKIVFVVFESSARDGSEINVVRVPVTIR